MKESIKKETDNDNDNNNNDQETSLPLIFKEWVFRKTKRCTSAPSAAVSNPRDPTIVACAKDVFAK